MTKETKQRVIDGLLEYIGDVRALMTKIEKDRPAPNDYQTLEDLLARTGLVTTDDILAALDQGNFNSWREFSEVRAIGDSSRVATVIGTLKGIVWFVTEELQNQRQKLIEQAKSEH